MGRGDLLPNDRTQRRGWPYVLESRGMCPAASAAVILLEISGFGASGTLPLPVSPNGSKANAHGNSEAGSEDLERRL